MADLDINSNIEPITKEMEQALSEFLVNRRKQRNTISKTSQTSFVNL
jgi:hypothetical protein